MSASKESSTSNSAKTDGFTADEKAAMKERARELKEEARRSKQADKAAADERDALDKIAEMQGSDRVMAERIHELVKANAPELAPKTMYGMPAYAKDGKVLCFFQGAQKFGTRYATLGFNDVANLDDGAMWPTTFALTELTDAVEERIVALLKKAVN